MAHTRRSPLRWVTAFATASLILAACGTGGETVAESTEEGDVQQEAADEEAAEGSTGHYAGESIDFVVPYSPGGGYDTYARLIAEELGPVLDAEVVVRNEPGAGGLQATNRVFAAGDDNTIVIPNMVGILGLELAGGEGAEYTASEFSWIGQVSSEPSLMTGATDGRIQSFEDMLAAGPEDPVRFAATGPGSLEYIDAFVLIELFGLNGEIVTGFEGGGEGFQSVLAGDTDAQSRSFGSMITTIEEGDGNPLLVVARDRVEELPDTPTYLEVGEEHGVDLGLLEAHADLTTSGRMIAGPPGMDPDKLEELRAAYETVATDEDFLAEMKEAGRPINYLSGAEAQELVEKLMASPPEFVELITRAYEG